MAYQCPRCGAPAERARSPMAAVLGGLLGALIAGAFASFQCAKCGPLASSEFPPELRKKMLLGSVGLVIAAVVLLVVVFTLVIYFNLNGTN